MSGPGSAPPADGAPAGAAATSRDDLVIDVRGLDKSFGDKHVVVDLSMGARDVRDHWRRMCVDAGVACELVVLTAPFEVLWERVKRRNDQERANAVRLTESRLRLYVDGFDWPAADEFARVITTG